MSTSFTTGSLAAGNSNQDRELNEFAQIQGLTAAAQSWLQNTLQIETVQELAELALDQVLNRLETDGNPVPRDQLEDWIDQAQALVAAQDSWRPFATFVVSLQSRQVGGENQQRTVVYFLEGDHRDIWPGLECDGVYGLMVNQLQRVFQLEPAVAGAASSAVSQPLAEPTSAPELTPEVGADLDQPGELPTPEQDAETSQPSESAAESPPTPVAEPASAPQFSLASPAAPGEKGQPTSLETMQLKLRQPPLLENNAVDQAESGETDGEETNPAIEILIDQQRRWAGRPLQADHPLDLEITFQLRGPGALALTRQALPYHAQVYGQNRITGEKSFLGKTSIAYLVDGELTYTCRLANLVLPQSDAYQLQVITQLEGGSVGPDLFELSFIQVI